ncbi:TetR/AcrR family transcriptional regulator [Streptomyces sp. H27-D2]|uniref:TetR/AcrR family transcriptional regulator n=1 Tax=Streptomyces sp. H27-D2 TaxID=3046304 RepID=UPI002DBEEA06|nr:TetR/AcrR family transcriptional regulator [Streptomyces sp. H27-D2]MEC4018317.1 TetR/AcrR family transcriptional regulator [Streptomyces sp. H27-D2]
MPTARESLLDAAYTILSSRPWDGVRMVDVAAAAGVSRQTLYNEFGSKEGLARALVRRETDSYLAGVDRVLSAAAVREGADAADCCAAAAVWTLRSARTNPLVRAALTGCRGERLPDAAVSAVPAVPAQRGSVPLGPDVGQVPGAPSANGLVAEFRRRAVAVLRESGVRGAGDGEGGARGGVTGGAGAVGEHDKEPDPVGIHWACEAAARLTLSYVLAPVGSDAEAGRLVSRLVRDVLVGVK